MPHMTGVVRTSPFGKGLALPWGPEISQTTCGVLSILLTPPYPLLKRILFPFGAKDSLT